MAPPSRGIVVLAEDLGSLPRTHMTACTHLQFQASQGCIVRPWSQKGGVEGPNRQLFQ